MMDTIVLLIRLVSFAILLCSSVVISFRSLLSFILFVGTIYLTGKLYPDSTTAQPNPFKRRGKIKDVDPTDNAAFAEKILDFVSYDAASSAVLDHFLPVQKNTECIFARTAKIWAAKPFIRALPLKANVERSLHLDGFVFELPHQEFGESPKTFGRGIRRLLKCLSDHDPAGRKCMDRSYIDKRGWYFEFDNESIFVTTFAPCYTSCHSRYAFGAKGCFILFQPDFSFATHDIGADTPHTNWESPSTVRDKIRVAYKNAGRPYTIRDTVYYPPAHDIVKPLQLHDPPVEWWKDE